MATADWWGIGNETPERRAAREAQLAQDLTALEGRAASARIKYERLYIKDQVLQSGSSDGIPAFLEIEFPCGTGTRKILARPQQWHDYPKFEKFRFIEGYQAVVDTETGHIWAVLSDPSKDTALEHIENLPGIPGTVETGTVEQITDVFGAKTRDRRSYRLYIEGVDGNLGISKDAPVFLIDQFTYMYGSRPYCLKIEPATGPKAARALDQLNGLARDFLFELDVTHNLGAILMAHRSRRESEFRLGPSLAEVRYPSVSYSTQAHALYWYAMGAGRFPLAQFLAYYQILEFYFPSFNRELVIQKLRRSLKHPRFSVSSSSEMNNLIDLTRDAHRGVKGEKSQLIGALRACIDEADLRQVLSQDPLKSKLCGKNKNIKGVENFNLTSGGDIFDQVATRIYVIRCRIVHTKESSDGSEFDLLLPNDDEANHLEADIQLVRILAQHAMIHGGQER